MSKPIHTPFFSGFLKPVREGVFQRRRLVRPYMSNQPHVSRVTYAKFKDGVWFCEHNSPIKASLEQNESCYQFIEWRGRIEA